MPLTYFPDPKKLGFRHGENDALELHMNGEVIPLAAPKRALPLSEPHRFIVLYDADRKELGMLCDINDLEPESKATLQKVLEKVYYIRHIARIIEINKEPATGQTRWRVELESEGEDGNTVPSAEAKNGNGNNHHSHGTNGHNSPSKIGGVLLNKLNLNKDSLNGNGNGKASSRPPREEVEFCIKGPEDVQTARYPYVFLVDVNGNRYDIPDCDALDLDSRRCSEGFL